jgi:short-subunit dehydrogenase
MVALSERALNRREPDFAKRYGPWALVAGASEGLGRQYAIQLAERGLSIIMVARQEARLLDAASEVRAKGVEVRTAAIDLGSEHLIRDIGEVLEGLAIGLLVYNAGLSTQSDFFEAEVGDHLEKLYVNCRGPVLLAHHLGRLMSERGRGGIILMSSVAGFVGSGLNALYSATKAFDIVLGEGLARDLEGSGVDVLSMVAGATRTPQFERSQTGKSRVPVMESADVVREALRSLGQTDVRVAGSNKAAALLLTRLLSRKRASALLTRASYAVSGRRRRE